MSSFPELEETPPSTEVQREMAFTQIRLFQAVNTDYRELVELIYRHPSSDRITRLREICGEVKDSSEPIVEAGFFRYIDPGLVGESVNVLIEEILQNRKLASALGGEDYDGDEFDEEFRQRLVERVLTDDQEPDEEDTPMVLFITDPLEELPTEDLIRFMGSLHERTMKDVLESLEESEDVEMKLEKEYLRKERVRTAVIGLVAFAGALGGSLLADKINKQK